MKTQLRSGLLSGLIAVCGATTIAWPQTVQYAEKFPGADAGEKIAHCLAALPPQGGICDARELSGPQRAGQGFTVGAADKPVELMLGPLTLAVGGTIHVQRRSSIVGMPAGAGIGTDQSASVLQAADNSALSAVVQIDGALAVVQDLTVDGNRKQAPRGRAAILVNQANRAELFRVTAQNAPGYGIEIYSSPRNESCCAKLQKVMAIANGQAGLHLANTADVFVSLSEFENNGTFGIELNNSPTTRIEHSDIGGNTLDGIRMYGTGGSPLQSNRQIIVGNQFGNNGRHDIAIAGFDETTNKYVSIGNLISSNAFIGSPTRPAGYDAIHIIDSADNTIVGNTFSAPRGHPFRSCVGISGNREGKDLVSANTCSASAAAADAFTGNSKTVFGPNQGKNAPTPQASPK